MMLNVVADEVGIGAAVLVRSCAPVSGNFLACLYLSSLIECLTQFFEAWIRIMCVCIV